MKFKKFLIYSYIFLNLWGFCLPEDCNQNDSQENQDQIVQAFNEFLQKQEEVYPGQDFMGGYQNAMLKVVEHQMKMLELLPESCKQNVIQTWEYWNDLVGKLEKPTDFLLDHCINIKIKIQEILQNNKNDKAYDEYDKIDNLQDNFLDFLNKIIEFLGSRDLEISIQFGYVEETLQKELESFYQEFDKQFDLLFQEYSKFDNSKLAQDIEILYACLVSLKNHDIQVLYKYKADLLKPQIDQAIKKLEVTLQELDDLIEDNQENDELLEVIVFWRDSLKKFEDFKDLEKSPNKESRSSKFISLFLKLSPYIKNGYIFYDNFFRLFKYDNNGKDLYKIDFFKLLKFQFSDAVKINFNSSINKPAVLSAFLVDKVWGSLFVPINLLENVMGKAKITSHNSMVVKSLMWQFISTCQIIIYYNTIHKWFLKNGEKLDSFSFPNEYKPFKKQVWSLIKNSGDIGVLFLQNKIKETVDPEILEKIEDYSLGVINPDLFKFSFDTIFPILIYKYFPKNIANFDKHKIFRPDPWDWYYVGKTDFKNMTEAEFIENRILGYLSVSFGGFVGKQIAYGCRKPVKSVLGSVGKFLLTKMGFIQEDFFSNIPEYKKIMLEEVKFLLSDKDDEMFIAAKQIFFSLILNFGIARKADVISLELAIERNNVTDEILDNFVDKIVTNLADNVVKSVGRGLGSWGGWHLGNYVSHKYGPFIAPKFA
ncbi:hypothetical protein K9M16_04610 [Candidatus Babeliales bacterium]|nr:hypothetical protein [Candidatus Babeliales bacterium]